MSVSVSFVIVAICRINTALPSIIMFSCHVFSGRVRQLVRQPHKELSHIVTGLPLRDTHWARELKVDWTIQFKIDFIKFSRSAQAFLFAFPHFPFARFSCFAIFIPKVLSPAM